jgi:hypothetical protein
LEKCLLLDSRFTFQIPNSKGGAFLAQSMGTHTKDRQREREREREREGHVCYVPIKHPLSPRALTHGRTSSPVTISRREKQKNNNRLVPSCKKH